MNSHLTSYFLPFLLLILSHHGLNAQLSLESDYFVNIQHFGLPQGLSHQNVYDIKKDQRGFLWIATQNGLDRFDGQSFKPYFLKGQKNHLPVSKILVDGQGLFWIVSSNQEIDQKGLKGINILNPDTDEYDTFSERFPNAPFDIAAIQFLSHAPDGKLYFLSFDYQLFTYNNQEGFQQYSLENLKEKKLHALFPQKNDLCILLTEEAKSFEFQFINSKGQIIKNIPTDNIKNRHNIYSTSDGKVWISDLENKQLKNLDGNGNWSDISLDFSHPYWDNHQLILEEDSKLWLAGRKVLLIYDLEEKGLIYDFSINDKNISNATKSVLLKDQNHVWVGTLGRGFFQVDFRKNPFQRYLYYPTDDPRFRTNQTRSILKDDQNRLWLKNVQNFLRLDGAAPPQIVKSKFGPKFFQSTTGKIYAGTGKTFAELDGDLNLIKEIKRPSNETNGRIWSIFEDESGHIWFGGVGIFGKYDIKDQNLIFFNTQKAFEPLSHLTIYDIQKGSKGQLLLCTSKGFFILNLVEQKCFRFWAKEALPFHLPAIDFHHLFLENDSTFWLATAGEGLIRAIINPATNQVHSYQQFNKSKGLSSDILHAVYPDNFGNLWLSSEYGIIQFDKQTFQSKAFLPEDGITAIEFNRIAHLQDEEGRIFFGSQNGVTAFHPQDFQHTFLGKFEAPLEISAFEQFSSSSDSLENRLTQLLSTNQIVLEPGDRFFNLTFNLLDYSNSPQIRYAYQIEKIHKDWLYIKHNQLNISSLPYGNFTLKIKGQGADGRYSANELNIQIVVLKPFYLKSWFVIFAILIVAASILAFIQWRTKSLQKQKRELEKTVAERTTQILEKNQQLEKDKKTIAQQATKLEKLDKVKNKFFANISHEFRTPLTVIQGMAKLLADGTYQKKTEASNLILNNSNQLFKLINQVLDLAKIDAGGLKLNNTRNDIIAFTQYVAESFQSYANNQNVRLVAHTETEQLIMDFDEDKLQKILSNLISNALKFTPEFGKIILQLSKHEETVLIKVIDSGVGISPEDLPKIFDRFYQTHQTGAIGTGIGLALSKELVELMGGKISVKSELKKGTAFLVELPIKFSAAIQNPGTSAFQKEHAPILKATEKSTQRKLQEQPSHSDELDTLLLIEDNTDVANYIQICLESHYLIHWAKNGKEGINKALELIPDIIISDVMMPEKNGFEVCNFLKNDERTSHIPIILLTAKADVDSRILGLERGADAYLAKPFEPKELLIRLEKLIELRKVLQSRYRNLELSTQQESSIQYKLEDAFLKKAFQIVEQHLADEDFGTQQLCRALRMSRSQVFRKIKALTGKSISVFIRTIRLRTAKQMLQNSEKTISEVCFDVGFKDVSNFSRAYKEEFGFRPSATSK